MRSRLGCQAKNVRDSRLAHVKDHVKVPSLQESWLFVLAWLISVLNVVKLLFLATSPLLHFYLFFHHLALGPSVRESRREKKTPTVRNLMQKKENMRGGEETKEKTVRLSHIDWVRVKTQIIVFTFAT